MVTADQTAEPSGRVPRDGVVQTQAMLLRKQHDGCRGELLGQRAHRVHSAVRCRDPLLYIRQTVSSRDQHTVTPKDGYRHPGDSLSGKLGVDESVTAVSWEGV